MLVSESPIVVGVSDPSRPDFPEYWVSVFSKSYFLYEHRRGQPATSLIPNSKAKINKNIGKSKRRINIFSYASTIGLSGFQSLFLKPNSDSRIKIYQ